MVVRNYSNLNDINNPHGIQSSKLYDSNHALIMHLLLKSGEKLKPHITPVDVVFYVLEGNPDILVGKEIYNARKDDIVESPKNIVHCIYNNSKYHVRIMVMKLPKPISKTRFIDVTEDK